MDKIVEKRFWEKVKKTDNCWLWMSTTHSNGNGFRYGYFRYGNKNVRAHRMSWIIQNGFIPDGKCICHTCDNPQCVNPSHLFIGSRLDNMRDAKVKNRLATGEKHGRAKLNWVIVGRIRKICQAGRSGGGIDAMARKFNIARSTIYKIMRNQTWQE